MRNRIEPHFQRATPSKQVATVAATPPTLKLKMEREFSVDMERFFEFSFSFAEALVDLENRYASPRKITTMERFLSARSPAESEQYDIDARWM